MTNSSVPEVWVTTPILEHSSNHRQIPSIVLTRSIELADGYESGIEDDFNDGTLHAVDVEDALTAEVTNIPSSAQKLDGQHYDINSCLEDCLTCPVCYSRPTASSPVYQCEHGHVVCASCYGRLHKCPVCRVRFYSPIRNLVAEKLVDCLHYR